MTTTVVNSSLAVRLIAPLPQVSRRTTGKTKHNYNNNRKKKKRQPPSTASKTVSPWGGAESGVARLEQIGRASAGGVPQPASGTLFGKACGNRFDGSDNLSLQMSKIELVERVCDRELPVTGACTSSSNPVHGGASAIPNTFEERNRKKKNQVALRSKRHIKGAPRGAIGAKGGRGSKINTSCGNGARQGRRPLRGKVFGMGILEQAIEDDNCAKMCLAGLIASINGGYSRVLAGEANAGDRPLPDALHLARRSLQGREKERGIRGMHSGYSPPPVSSFLQDGRRRSGAQQQANHGRQWRRRRLRARPQAGARALEQSHHHRRAGAHRAASASPLGAASSRSQAFESYERFLRQQQERPHSGSGRRYEGLAAAWDQRVRPHTSSGGTRPPSSVYMRTAEASFQEKRSRSRGRSRNRHLGPPADPPAMSPAGAGGAEENTVAIHAGVSAAAKKGNACGMMRRLCQFYAESIADDTGGDTTTTCTNTDEEGAQIHSTVRVS